MVARRSLRRTTASASARLKARFASLFSPGDMWFDAYHYTVDGVTGKVGGFVDRVNPTHALTQSTSLNQVALPAAHADFGGRPCATFTGAEQYSSNLTASAFNWWSSGAGYAEVHCIAAPTSVASAQFWLSSRTSGTGATLYNNSGTGTWFANNATAIEAIVSTPAGSPAWIGAIMRPGGPGVGSVTLCSKGVGVRTNLFQNNPGPAENPVCLGARPNGANRAQMRWIAWFAFNRELNTNDRNIMINGVRVLYGVQ